MVRKLSVVTVLVLLNLSMLAASVGAADQLLHSSWVISDAHTNADPDRGYVGGMVVFWNEKSYFTARDGRIAEILEWKYLERGKRFFIEGKSNGLCIKATCLIDGEDVLRLFMNLSDKGPEGLEFPATAKEKCHQAFECRRIPVAEAKAALLNVGVELTTE